MELYIYAFTETGRTLADKIQKNLPGASVFLYRKKEDLHLLEQIWSKSGLRGVLFVGAVGIAVRLIAPLVKNKLTDPAVLVMDERALHVIPILSGHYGGANELALQLAKITGAEPVITTATDIQGRFAVDVFARKNGLAIFPKEHIKVISGAILRGEPVGFTTEIPVQGQVPEGLRYYKRFGTTDDSGKKPDEACGIYLGESQESPYACTLQLLPRNLIAGVGCRRGKSGIELEAFLINVLETRGMILNRLCAVASIEQKADEAGILELAQKLGVPYYTYTAQELAAVPGEFSDSEFVAQRMGVGNVCERAAVLAASRNASDAILLIPKQSENGMTLAIARRNTCISF